jgi:hypothetical protein
MKKSFISFLLILICSNSFANVTFLSAINEDFSPISYNELKELIKSHAKSQGYLSLGESHLQQSTASAVNYDLLTTYLDNTESINRNVFCSETLSHFSTPYEDLIKNIVNKYKTFTGNSPYKTDFSKCLDRNKFRNYVTYSGFFHQYPFARSFPNEFLATPVIKDSDNNILAQMSKKRHDTNSGFFVTQMELEYLEFSSTKALLEMGLTDAKKIRSYILKLENVVNTLVKNMETILPSDNQFTSKKAVVVKASDFNVEMNGNANSYFLITNLDYRGITQSLKTLKAIATQTDEEINQFLTKLTNSQKRVSVVFLGPFPDGNLGTVTVPGITRSFEGQSILIRIKNVVENYLMVMEPTAKAFKCIQIDTDKEISCF